MGYAVTVPWNKEEKKSHPTNIISTLIPNQYHTQTKVYRNRIIV